MWSARGEMKSQRGRAEQGEGVFVNVQPHNGKVHGEMAGTAGSREKT